MILRLNDRNELVKSLQAALGLQADGNFGPATDSAVRAFQQKNGLTADGMAGPATLGKLKIDPVAIRYGVSAAQYREVAAEVGIDVATLKAFVSVEAAGKGFLDDGRPKILYERHYFYRGFTDIVKQNLSKPQLIAERDRLTITSRDICYPSASSNKKGTPTIDRYLGGAAEYERLGRASAISDTLAITSASWGLGQIMGAHWKRLGFATPQHFRRAMEASEVDQLRAIGLFIKTDADLLNAIKARNWARVARIYNGPNYAVYEYDKKLAKAYERFAKEA